ncbi:MAG TPA: class I SAM-dependent methyltransferase [Bryobacteraceae bacterium]|nr:class I SAM-dependent methyltransferase [Bryobacteraceae bacterium]
MASDAEKIAELNAIVEAVRERVRGAHRNGAGLSSGGFPPIHLQSADLMPIVHARDAAQAKVAAIGAVNPRAGGLVNKIVQAVKKTIARALQWFVRDQIVFNRESIAALEATIEALAAMNRELLTLAAQTNERFSVLDSVIAEARELRDIREHWIGWRTGWEQKLAANEIQFLRATADLQGAFQHRATLIESNFREIVQAQHRDYLGALDRYGIDIQKRLWADLEKVREQYERMIHAELRLIRLRAGTAATPAAVPSNVPAAMPTPAPSAASGLDYSRFAERFRGTDEEIRRNMEFYRPIFAGKENVLDIGCGRGEFLDVMREAGVPARGIDLSNECIQQCRDKGLQAEVADLFPFLAAQPDEEFDGILSSQVVEHLPPDRLPEMVRLCAAKLRRGGILALETPNPECLAIFATYFYLDPTHTRPMPHQYLQFCMEEAGLTGIEVHRLNPAVDTMPELASLPADFRERFFGGLDYAIIGRRI